MRDNESAVAVGNRCRPGMRWGEEERSPRQTGKTIKTVRCALCAMPFALCRRAAFGLDKRGAGERYSAPSKGKGVAFGLSFPLRCGVV
jgi:hypothetical protein